MRWGAHARDELGISDTLSARPCRPRWLRRPPLPWGRPCRFWWCSRRPNLCSGLVGVAQFAGLSRAAWLPGRPSRRFSRLARRRARDVLGGPRDGDHRRCGSTVWGGGVSVRLRQSSSSGSATMNPANSQFQAPAGVARSFCIRAPARHAGSMGQPVKGIKWQQTGAAEPPEQGAPSGVEQGRVDPASEAKPAAEAPSNP